MASEENDIARSGSLTTATNGDAVAIAEPKRKVADAASRDWGFAGDYVEAMWLILQQDEPDDYVVATEESHTVKQFLQIAFGYVGLNWKDHVVIDKRYFRPAEVDNLKGDVCKAKEVLGWKPKVGFEQLVKMMVVEDIELAKREKVLVDAGYMDSQQPP